MALHDVYQPAKLVGGLTRSARMTLRGGSALSGCLAGYDVDSRLS
jgi:hypothetical protein